MKKRRKAGKVFRILGWIVAGCVGLVALLTLSFYLSRGWIMKKAVAYLNNMQPGDLEMGQMNLIPFMNFPDVSLQLKDVAYYERKGAPDSLPPEPILSLDEVFVTLDVIQLIKGKVLLSESTLKDGFVRGLVYPDSVTNLERALGIRFGEEPEPDSLGEEAPIRIDLRRIGLSNILILFDDQTSGDRISLGMNRLESRFSYLGDKIHAALDLELDVNYLKYLTYRIEDKRSLAFKSELSIDVKQKIAEVEPSMLQVSGLELETWGSYNYRRGHQVDLAFRASNEGLEVLNYLFRGVLDLDEIEQIGSGSIYLNGNINGSLDDQLPVVRINGTADDIGFRIKSIGKDVTHISFRLYFTNGGALDFSDGQIVVEDFTATFPEGTLNANMTARDFTSPALDMDLSGAFQLEGLEQVLKSDAVEDLKGTITVSGRINGAMDKTTGQFLNGAGRIEAGLREVGFLIRQDSGRVDSIQMLNGTIYLEENRLGAEEISCNWNGTPLSVDANTENLLLYLLGFDSPVNARITLRSDRVLPYHITMDSSLVKMLGDTVRGIYLKADASIRKEEMDRYLKEDSIPEFHLAVDSLSIQWPVYAPVNDLEAFLDIGPDTIYIESLDGTLGSSSFSMSGTVDNYDALLNKDTMETVGISCDISSELLQAGDLFTLNKEFRLPGAYRTEYLRDFRLNGSVSVPVKGLVLDSADLDFGVDIRDLGWNFRYYPYPFERFILKARREGDQLFIDDFQGNVGESNLKMKASLGNFTDSLIERMYGNLTLESDLLDFDALLNYQNPEEEDDSTPADTGETRAPPRLDQIAYPRVEFNVDIGELRYGKYRIFGMDGAFRSTPEKIFYLDHFATSAESGGKLEFNGQFNVANPALYTLSAEVGTEGVRISDLDIPLQSGDEVYTLKEKFQGAVTADGLVEVYITPDLKVDMSYTTAIFNMKVTDGAIINFTPLMEAGKYLDNRDLSNVRFATLQQFGFTLANSRIIIPLMNVESTAGQLLIEGEQGLDNSYLYLVRIPPKMAVEAAQSVLSSADGKTKKEDIEEMTHARFIQITVWSDGVASDIKLGDRRDRYQQ